MTIPYTTFKKLRKAGACKERYAHLRRVLKGVKDDEPISLVKILKTNGLEDVLWIPENIIEGDNISKRYRLFSVACCQDILRLMEDTESIEAVKAAHLFAHNEIDEEELAAARAAARDTARAAWAARAAAWDAAWYAAWAAAWATAWAAAWDAAREKQKQHFQIIFSAEF